MLKKLEFSTKARTKKRQKLRLLVVTICYLRLPNMGTNVGTNPYFKLIHLL